MLSGYDRKPRWVRDLPAGGRPVTLVWFKRVWRCAEPTCGRRTWSERHPAIRPRAVLTERALDQAWSFGAETSVMRAVTDLRADGDHRAVVLADGAEVTARAVVLATGASYQRLGIPRVEALVGAGVFYGGGITEAPEMTGQLVYVVGAGNSAGQAAAHLAKYADRVVVVRGDGLAASMSDYLVKTIEATENIDVHLHTTVIGAHGAERLEELVLHDVTSGQTRTVPAAALFVLIGAQPHTDWLPAEIDRDDKGFILTGTRPHTLVAPTPPGQGSRPF